MTDSSILFLLDLNYILKEYFQNSRYISLKGITIFHINVPRERVFLAERA